ncbi:MAG TPA: polysaccharide deacetylase family protein [Vicinamibacterales bacterium]
MSVAKLGVPFAERGGPVRGALDLIAGHYPAFVFGGSVGSLLPVFHFHEATPDLIEPVFAYLAENGYRAVGTEELSTLVRQRRHPGPQTVMLAFDDALASLWSVAGPLLRRYHLRAVTYAIPWRVRDAPAVRPTIENGGGPDAAAVDAGEDQFVTWPELRALSASGLVEVQSHTYTHSVVFTDDRVRDFVQPSYARQSVFHRPRIGSVRDPAYVPVSALGHPIFGRRSRMSDGRRFLPDPAACRALIDYVAANGGPDFFERPDWLGDLRGRAGSIGGRWEAERDREREIEEELAISRDVLSLRLGTPVKHACLPWGVSGAATTRALQRVGYETAFANRWRGRLAVAAGDEPYFLKRLHHRYVFSLPGRSRRTWQLRPT